MNTQLQNILKANVKSAAQASCNPMCATEHVRVNQFFVVLCGGEQTDVDFYQVVAVGVRKITFRKVVTRKIWNEDKATGGTCEPVTDEFTGETFWRLYDAKYQCVVIDAGAFGCLWNNKPVSFTCKV